MVLVMVVPCESVENGLLQNEVFCKVTAAGIQLEAALWHNHAFNKIRPARVLATLP